MTLSRYPDYKHSGVDWLGEVPSHWDIERLKNVITLRKITVGDTKGDYTLLSLTLQGVVARDMENPKGKFPAEFDTYQVVEKDDLVFCLFDVEETPRAVGISPCTGMVTGAYTVGRVKKGTSPEYLYNFYLSRDQYKAFKMYYTGLRNVIRSETFNAIPFPVPPINEQIGISIFLVNETAKIDKLITEQENLIALLGEKRQAVISHAVTKGLDPIVKTKDSGVEWLGKVPLHWSLSPLKKLLSIQNGSDYKNIEQADGYPVFGSGGVFAFASKYLHDGESVLLGRKGTVDKPLYVNGKFWTVDTMYWSKILNNFSAKFCYYIANTIPFGYYSTKTALPSMTKSKLNDHLIAHPARAEQDAIVDFLDKKLEELDKLIYTAKEIINLLLERRSALISAAVTGQIDVRNYQAKETA